MSGDRDHNEYWAEKPQAPSKERIQDLLVGDLVLVDSRRGPDVLEPRNDIERGMRIYVVWYADEYVVRIRKVNSSVGTDLLVGQPDLVKWKYLTRDQASAILYAV